MSEEQIQALINALKVDTSLQEWFKAVANLVEMMAIAKETGFDVTKAELLQVQSQTVELSDEEWGSVAGGMWKYGKGKVYGV